MPIEEIHTLVLGAGPAGLAAGYTLAKAGLKPVVLEKDKVCGGLMRSIKRGDFIMDIGRKELYNRIAKVDAFWTQLLGDDYRLYAHRGGVLYEGQIIDISAAYQGFRRGMSWPTFLRCSTDFLWQQAGIGAARPRTVEEYFYRKRGRLLTRIVSQGFQEKLLGKKWAEIPLSEQQNNGHQAGFLKSIKEVLSRTFHDKEPNTFKGIWRHPSRGTGLICETMERGIRAGGRVYTEAKLLEMTPANGRIEAVKAQIGSEEFTFKPKNIISSIPLEFLIQFITHKRFDAGAGSYQEAPAPRKTVVLVYLFMNEEPRFPHAWLNVTCPTTRMGRITNYTAMNGEMVPKGKTCLCCEYYCFGADPLLALNDQQIAEQTIAECAKFHLIDRSKCFDNLVLRFPGADASQNRANWLSKLRLGMLEELKPYKNLYYANRTDLDIATLAGIESAEAVISGDRTIFDRHIDPAELQIRSESKAFEFKNPALQGI